MLTLCLVLALGLLPTASSVPPGTVVVKKRYWCPEVVDYGNASTIKIGTPLSLSRDARHGVLGNAIANAFDLHFDWLRRTHCGLSVNGTLHPLELVLVDDKSLSSQAALAAEYLLEKEGLEYFVGPYSSGLTSAVAPLVQQAGKVMIAGSASLSSIFQGRPNIFGLPSSADRFAETAVEAVSLAAGGIPKTFMVMAEDASVKKAQCGVVQGLAEAHGMRMLGEMMVVPRGTTDTASIVANLSAAQPDFFVQCVYSFTCHSMLNQSKVQQFRPKAIIIVGACVTEPGFLDTVKNAGQFVLGVVTWLPDLQLQGQVTGNWTAASFAREFEDRYGDVPPYHAASGFAAISSLTFAMQRAQSLQVTDIVKVLTEMNETSLFGKHCFDENGQSRNPMKVVQFQGSTKESLVAPAEVANAELKYPMPSWVAMECINVDVGYQSAYGKSRNGECILCPVGTMSVVRNTSLRECVACSPGQAGVMVDGLPTCFACAPGQYASSFKSTECVACEKGTFGNRTGMSSCFNCAPGSSVAVIGARECTECQFGFYQDAAGQSACRRCSLGTFVHEVAATACQGCPKASSDNALSLVTDSEAAMDLSDCVCPEGSYLSGQECQLCGIFLTTAGSGKTSSADCHMSQRSTRTAVGIVSGTTVLLLIGLLVWCWMRRRLARFESERNELLQGRVHEGLCTLQQLGHPMVVVGALEFCDLVWHSLAGGHKNQHESLRDQGKLVIMDTESQVRKFRNSDRRIVFFSYQRLSWSRMGPNAVQWEWMKRALTEYSQKENIPLRSIYVWLDVLSIPQSHRGVQMLAINSLYTYATAVDTLIIIAPESVHEDTNEEANTETYKTRCWTRIEQVAYLSCHPLSTMFLATKSGSLEPVDEAWVASVVKVFDGKMTCCRLKHTGQVKCDKESLVPALLGLWYIACAAHLGIIPCDEEQTGVGLLYKLMSEDKASTFPSRIEFLKEVGDGRATSVLGVRPSKQGETVHYGTRPLFEDLISRTERYLLSQSPQDVQKLLGFEDSLVGSRWSQLTSTRSEGTSSNGRQKTSESAAEEEIICPPIESTGGLVVTAKFIGHERL